MHYKAIYNNEEAIEAAKKAMLSLIKKDGYYPMYDTTSGTGIVNRYLTDGGWWEDEFYCNGKKVSEMTIEDIPTEVSWTSCADNKITYTITTGGVVVEINSRRHGIPCMAMARFKPSEFLEYQSTQDHWGPFETLEDHPEDKPLSPKAEWADQFALPKHIGMRV